MVEVIFYTSESGRVPVRENLDSLPEPDQAKAAAHLLLLEHYGSSLREPHVKHMQDKLNELRFRISAGHYRVFFFFQVGAKAILVHSIIKKTPTTPKADLDLALKRMRNWLSRNGA